MNKNESTHIHLPKVAVGMMILAGSCLISEYIVFLLNFHVSPQYTVFITCIFFFIGLLAGSLFVIFDIIPATTRNSLSRIALKAVIILVIASIMAFSGYCIERFALGFH